MAHAAGTTRNIHKPTHPETTNLMTTIPCTVLPDDTTNLPLPQKYAACPPQSLRRSWEGPDALPTEPGVARIGASSQGLCVYVEYEDSDIFSEAKADQQKMWTLGDVAEVFVKPGLDRPDYWEIHVTPNGFMMDIRIPDRGRFQAGEVTWDQVIAADSGVIHQSVVEEGRWSAEFVIPWSAFEVEAAPSPGTIWQVAVCRYNCNGGLENPELSSTAPLTKPGFHRFEEFSDLVF